MFRKLFAAATLVAALFAAPALAGEIKAGDLVISQPWARATPGGAKVAGGYLVVRNTGAAADRLIGGTAPFAGRVEIHEMSMEGGVMVMRPLADGLEIPPGGEVVLKPGGYHVMFMALTGPLAEGETHRVTLAFARAGTVDLDFAVAAIGAREAPKSGD